MKEERISGKMPVPEGSYSFVLYWMQQAQRVEANHALNLAIRLANERKLALRVVFVLSDRVPDANLRHFQFMLEGLAETAAKLDRLDLEFHLCAGEPGEVVASLASGNAIVVTDRGYLRWQRKWRADLQSRLAGQACLEVESDVVVPVQTASNKEEYAAATIRGKILKRLEEFLEQDPLPKYEARPGKEMTVPEGIPHMRFRPGMQAQELLNFARSHLDLDESVSPSPQFRGGHSEAVKHLNLFLDKRLHQYAEKRNDPSLNIQSNLSPYLHFGQISPLEVALQVLEYCGVPAYAAAGLIKDKSGLEPLQAGVASFLEELIVRRELSCNFCHYNAAYDDYACVPLWARKTLNDHLADPRPVLYSPQELETAQTADPHWNAAQTEMVVTGKMQNYMRMYWGKKIIQWTPDPETAFSLMLWLNNKYELDGRDPNTYAGIAWCFGKHDRPWQSRAIFGSVRYMNAAGLRRKFDMAGYLEKVKPLSSPF